MERVFLIHGWTGTPNEGFILWAIKKLTKLGFEVHAPQMPGTDHPKITPWVNKIKETVGEPREDDIFIGHSIGCQAVERYLQTLPVGTKIKKVILIAPWIILTEQTFQDLEEDRKIVEPWYSEPIEYEKIKNMAKWIAVFSDDDPYVKYEDNYKVYQDKLGAKIILEKGKGHFAQEQGVTELPLLLDLL